MNEKCSSCGNYVEGKKKATIGRKMTRGAVKKGSAVATGALIGSVVPGLGTLVGGALGLAASALMSDTTTQAADEMYDAAVGEIEYEFSCPKCGRKWTKKVNTLQQNQSNASSGSSHNTSNRQSSNQSNTYSQPATPRYDNTNWQEKFNKEFDSYLKSTEKILSSKDCVKQYVNDLKYKFGTCHDDVICSEFHFLRAFACLQYSLNNSDDKSLILLGQNLISTAISCLDDEEYKLVSLLFEILAVDTKTGNAPTKIKKLQQRCPDISAMENTLFQTGYWRSIYDDICFNQLIDTVIYFEEQNKDGVVVDALQRISELSDIGYKIYAYNFLFGYFVETDVNRCFVYAQKAVSIADFENDYNPEIPMHRTWLDCVNQLGYCYENGVGTAVNYGMAFELFQKCAKLGLPVGMFNMAECYEYGWGVGKDTRTALEWYKKAADLGHETSKAKLNEYEGKTISSYPEGTLFKEEFYMDIEDVFEITGCGVVVTGQVKAGCINAGDRIILINKQNNYYKVCQIAGIEMFRKLLDFCEEGDNVGILLNEIKNKNEIPRGTSVQYYNENDALEKSTSLTESITLDEQIYLDELKACLEEDNEISPKERRLLERLREKLGITPERAKELEDLLSAPQLTDEEKEYLEEYKACVEDDIEISPKERRLLNRIRESLGISEERALEIEKL